MKTPFLPVLLALTALAPAADDSPAVSKDAPPSVQPSDTPQQDMSIYDMKVTAQDGKEVALAEYKGKVLLIVNTATHCGFTPQYNELQALYARYHDQGFEILDFPCNQFGAQAPGSDEEIHSFCSLRFGTQFPQFAKVDVNGPHAAPLFRYLTTHTTFAGFGDSPMAKRMENIAARQDPHFRSNGSIKWNFTKFLIDRSGQIIARFEPTAEMSRIQEQIEALLH